MNAAPEPTQGPPDPLAGSHGWRGRDAVKVARSAAGVCWRVVQGQEDDGFETVYRQGRLWRVVHYLDLPFELGVATLGGLLLVALIVGLVTGEAELREWTTLVPWILGAGLFTWWGGSSTVRLVIDLVRGVRTHEVRADSVETGRGKWWQPPTIYWTLKAGERAWSVRLPPPELKRGVSVGDHVRIRAHAGTNVVVEVAVRRSTRTKSSSASKGRDTTKR